MRLPRKGILIRLAIYVPVIAFLAYNAFCSGPKEPPKTIEIEFGGAKTPPPEAAPAKGDGKDAAPEPAAADPNSAPAQ